jgi:hypothetical protein
LVIQKKSLSQDSDLPSYVDSLVPTLLNKVVIPAAIPGPKTKILCSPEILKVVALIVNAVVREADVSKQNAFYIELFKLFLTSESSNLASSNQEAFVRHFHPLDPDAEGVQAQTVQIFVSAVAAARKEVRSSVIILTIGFSSSSEYQPPLTTSCRDRHVSSR